MTDRGAWAYRIRVSREHLREPANTATAIRVADSRSQFREVVFATRIDAELTPDGLGSEERELLERAIGRETYVEDAPLSGSFDALLEALALDDVETASNGNRLWYDGGLYRYALYVDSGDD